MLVSKEQLFFVQYHFYLFLTLLLFYKIGNLEHKAFLRLHSFQINTMKLLIVLQGDSNSCLPQQSVPGD